jgi:hypothetical protein
MNKLGISNIFVSISNTDTLVFATALPKAGDEMKSIVLEVKCKELIGLP